MGIFRGKSISFTKRFTAQLNKRTIRLNCLKLFNETNKTSEIIKEIE